MNPYKWKHFKCKNVARKQNSKPVQRPSLKIVVALDFYFDAYCIWGMSAREFVFTVDIYVYSSHPLLTFLCAFSVLLLNYMAGCFLYNWRKNVL